MITKRNIKLIKDQYTKYFGEVNEFGQKDGYRIEYSDNSTCYVGQFKNGKRCGFGTYTSNYYSYVGEFYDDDYEGYGIYTTSDGEMYEGHGRTWNWEIQNV